LLLLLLLLLLLMLLNRMCPYLKGRYRTAPAELSVIWKRTLLLCS